MSPLTIIERHPHKLKTFPNPDKNSLEGVDATISMGWLDLKVKNNTNYLFQVLIEFDKDYMSAKILSDKKFFEEWSIINDNHHYFTKNGKTFESVDIVKITYQKNSKKELKRELLYTEVVEITYELPKNITLKNKNNL